MQTRVRNITRRDLTTRMSILKAGIAFVVMFVASFYLSGVMLVDYPDYIENRRHQIGQLSKLLNHNLGQALESETIVRGERGCRQKWDDVKNNLSDLVEFISMACVLLLLFLSSERLLISKKRSHVHVDYRWLKGKKHAGWIIFSGMLISCGIVYVVMTALSRCMLTFLMWPRIVGVVGVDASTRCQQLLSAWDQLLVCDMWIGVCYCLCGLCVSLVIVVWLLANVHFVRPNPSPTPRL